MISIELILSPLLYAVRQTEMPHAVVAVDVLRATSAICAAFSAGAKSIVPLDNLEALANFRDLGYTLAAERDGKKAEGATCGNSPTEYLSMDLHGQRLAYSTTNGTRSILCARDAARLYIGAFSNIDALSARIVSDTPQLPIVILCSGWKGDPCIEDTLFGGALVTSLRHKTDIQIIGDAATIAETLWGHTHSNLLNYCQRATHVGRLQKLGYQRDIEWSLQTNTCPLVPIYHHDTQNITL